MVASGIFGFRQSLVCACKQGIPFFAPATHRSTHRDLDREWFRLAEDGFFGNSDADTLSRSQQLLFISHMHQADKLFTAVASQKVIATHQVVQPMGQRLEHIVTGQMSQTVIDLFEVIQINQQHANCRAATVLRDHVTFKKLQHGATVVALGQRVARCHLADRTKGSA